MSKSSTNCSCASNGWIADRRLGVGTIDRECLNLVPILLVQAMDCSHHQCVFHIPLTMYLSLPQMNVDTTSEQTKIYMELPRLYLPCSFQFSYTSRLLLIGLSFFLFFSNLELINLFSHSPVVNPRWGLCRYWVRVNPKMAVGVFMRAGGGKGRWRCDRGGY